MTAVVRLNFEDRVPILIGDVLLSRPKNAGTSSFHLPTIESTKRLRLPDETRAAPSGVAQKLSIIDKLAIGWSGNLVEAKGIITHFYDIRSTGLLTIDYVRKHIQTADKETGFVGFMIDGPSLHWFGHNCDGFETDNLGQVAYLGSGAGDLIRGLGQYRKVVNVSGVPDDPFAKAISLSLALTGQLLQAEVATGSSLVNHAYGGGYEIVLPSSTGFQKSKDITYAFWRAKVEKDVKISRLPERVCVYGYNDDVLSIRSFSPEMEPLEQSCQHISPIYRHITDDEFKRLKVQQVNNQLICNHFWVENSGPPEIFTQLEARQNQEEQVLLFEEENGKFTIKVRHDFIESVRRAIAERFKDRR